MTYDCMKCGSIPAVKDAFTRTRDKALFILGLKTGLRVSELLSLKVGDVYQYGRLADMVYVERKHMKKKLEGRAIPLQQGRQSRFERLGPRESLSVSSGGLGASNQPQVRMQKLFRLTTHFFSP